MMHIFLENVDHILKQKGKRRTWLSKQTDIALSTINSWFSKDILPKIDDALKVAQVLNTSLDYLATGRGLPAGHDPALQNIITFLKEQNHETLVNIESSLTLFNYVNVTQDMESTPALMLDKNLYITWVNDKFIKVFGKDSGIIGSKLLTAADPLPALEYIDEETPSPPPVNTRSGKNAAQDQSNARTAKSTSAETAKTADEDQGLIPVSADGLELINTDAPQTSALLRNIVLIPIYRSYKSRKKMEMPQGYAGVFVDINQDNKYAIDNIFMKLAEISLLKEKNSVAAIHRIRRYIDILCRALMERPEYPEINEGFIRDLMFFAPMHDIGKIGIPDDILNKKGKLDEWEWQLIKEHTLNGAYILSAYPNPIGKEIALQHHEKWDGTGYPYGLSGTMIALSARITAICITYDAIMSERPYRDTNTHEEAIKIIAKEKGKYFEPLLVDTFLELEPQIKQVAFEIE
jgi:HD-GYP domain-containing protein (c-di-GMP phosphodiesterase class II)/transcriptional regulator with XRE-family HTH domain